MHNKLIDAIIQSRCHVIATMRSKTAYEIQTDSKGKVKPVKLGLAPVQREGVDYEFTVVLDLDKDKHVATASKDRTGLFDNQVSLVNVETGRKLREWLDSGVEEPPYSLDAYTADSEKATNDAELKAVWNKYATQIKRAGLTKEAVNIAAQIKAKWQPQEAV
jgi:hypothetical protein